MAELKSTRAKDSELEKAMQRHYNLIYRINNLGYKRCDEKSLQLVGQDLTIATKNGQHIVDEKCATSYWNKPLNTFAMELSFDMCDKQSGEPIGKRYDGWFINPNITTTLYSLGYVSADNEEDLHKGRLSSFECILIKKQAIADYLKDTFKVESIWEIEDRFIDAIEDEHGNAYRNGKGGWAWIVNDDIKLVRSDNLAEKPINIVISKNVLGSLSDLHCKIEYHGGGFNYTRYKN